MDLKLTDIEIRLLGSLIEKELTTPDYYPLSLNSLMTACNQTSNRNPVVHYSEGDVAEAAESLREKNLVHRVERGESRVLKYRHVVYETLNLRRPAVAALDVMLLRGPQTAAEIRARSNRLYDFSGIEEVETTLDSMISRNPPLVTRIARQSGQKEGRFAHLLSGEPPVMQEITPEEPGDDDRIARLERDIADLRRQFEEFRQRFE